MYIYVYVCVDSYTSSTLVWPYSSNHVVNLAFGRYIIQPRACRKLVRLTQQALPYILCVVASALRCHNLSYAIIQRISVSLTHVAILYAYMHQHEHHLY
jgi:hypothetical protein